MIAAGSGDDPTVSQVPPRVVFVVTVRNNASLLDSCLRTVAEQDYPDVACIIVDDASEDATAAVASRWATQHSDVFTAIRTDRRRGKMANLVNAVSNLDLHDVIVELDGDDQLLCADAASDLARLHMRLDLVWTQHRIARHQWQSFPHFRSTDLPPAYRYGADLPRLRWTRTWHPSHLRSFKAWAFHRIELEDLQVDGDWVQASPDFAYFTPLVEMTPPALRYFYDRELAVYNITASNEKFRDDPSRPPGLQAYVVDQLVTRPPYGTRQAPLWVGIIDSTTQQTFQRISEEQIAEEPATRFLLAADHPIPASWHPRVQIIGRYTIVPSETAVVDRTRAALRWLTQYAAELGYRDLTGRQPFPDLPLRQLQLSGVAVEQAAYHGCRSEADLPLASPGHRQDPSRVG
jgi:hypothetical protein